MNRLTYQKRDGNYSIRFDLGNLQQVDIKAMNKLGKLENIEEELGCPLEVVFKALKDGQVITKHIVGSENPKVILLPHKIAEILFDVKNYSLWAYENGDGDGFYLNTKDYKKTWWLKEDRSE